MLRCICANFAPMADVTRCQRELKVRKNYRHGPGIEEYISIDMLCCTMVMVRVKGRDCIRRLMVVVCPTLHWHATIYCPKVLELLPLETRFLTLSSARTFFKTCESMFLKRRADRLSGTRHVCPMNRYPFFLLYSYDCCRNAF